MEENFRFGIPTNSLTYLQLKSQMGSPIPDAQVSLVGFTIVLFEVWARIAKWVGEVGVKHETVSPWLPDSAFHQLCESLDEIANSLPQNFTLTNFNFKTHIGLGTATHFGYFHGLFLLCRIFLTREYLFCNPKSFPHNWWKKHTTQLLDSLEMFSLMVETLSKSNMMVIAPFTGFELFTCAVTSFYFCAFPNDVLLAHFLTENSSEYENSSVEQWKFKYKKIALNSLDLLTRWSDAWELGRKWQRLSVSLGVLFGQYAQTGLEELNSDYMRHSMQDYGNSEVGESKTINIQKVADSEESLLGTDLVGDAMGSVQSELSYGAIEQLLLPAFPFSDSPSIYPGWLGDDILDSVLEK